MKRYVPNQKISFPGLILGFAAVLLVGAVIGIAAFAISQVFYFTILSPLAISFAGGMVIQKIVKTGKIRNPTVAIFLGFGLGLVIYGTFRYAGYIYTRNETVSLWQQEYNIDRTQALASFEQALQDETGIEGFWGFLKLVADDGINLTGHLMLGGTYIPMPSMTLKSGGVWLYWFFEMILIFLFPVSLSRDTTPFCEKHQTWYGIAKQVGNIDPGNLKLFTSFLRKELLRDAGELIIEGEQLTHPTIEVYKQHCSKKEAGDVLLTIKQTYRDSEGQLKRQIEQQYELSADEFIELSDHFTKNS